MNRKHNIAVLLNNRGSALVTTFLVLIVLVALGLAMTTLAVANFQQSTTIDNYERNYYSAEGAAQLAVDNLKREVMDYYNDMAIARANTANLSQYNVLYDNFFANIRSNAAASFAEPEVAVSEGAGPDTISTTYLAPVKIDSDSYRYTIESTATGARAARTVTASIVIKRNGITYIPGSLPPPYGEQSIIAGGTFDRSSTDTKVTVSIDNALGKGYGSVLVGAYKNRDPSVITPEQAYAATSDGLNMKNRTAGGWIDPSTAMGINWDESYPGFSKPDLASMESLDASSYRSANYTGTSSNWRTLYCAGDVSFSKSTIGFVRIYCDGDFNWDGGTQTNNTKVEIYCKGNVTIENLARTDFKIVCDGNVTIIGGNSTNVTVYCKGDFTDSSTSRANAQYYVGGAYAMSGGNFSGKSVVYAEKKLTIGSVCSGFFYTNGDAVINRGGSLTGQLVAKGDVIIRESYNFKYDASTVNGALANLDGTPLDPSGAKEPQIIMPVNGAIFMDETEPKDKD